MNIVSRVNAITTQLKETVEQYWKCSSDPEVIETGSGPLLKLNSKKIRPGLVTSVARFKRNINHIPLVYLIPITSHITSVGAIVNKEKICRGSQVKLFNNCTIVYILEFQVKIYDTKLQICNARNMRILGALVTAISDLVTLCSLYHKKLSSWGEFTLVNEVEKACRKSFIDYEDGKVVIDREFSIPSAIEPSVYKAIRHFVSEDSITFNRFKKYMSGIFSADINRPLKIAVYGHVLVNRNFNIGRNINLRDFSLFVSAAETHISIDYNEILNTKRLRLLYKTEQNLSNEFRRASNSDNGYDSTFMVRANGSITQMSIPGYEHVAYEELYTQLEQYFNSVKEQ